MSLFDRSSNAHFYLILSSIDPNPLGFSSYPRLSSWIQNFRLLYSSTCRYRYLTSSISISPSSPLYDQLYIRLHIDPRLEYPHPQPSLYIDRSLFLDYPKYYPRPFSMIRPRQLDDMNHMAMVHIIFLVFRLGVICRLKHLEAVDSHKIPSRDVISCASTNS